ncbi:MAG: hypothetical protein DLM69_10675 [Candidatus Chloroheliales bacterium]|nr:MAG: hypothetical protein DLM69_10675 [Chloroflexota bacterium]
MATDATGQERLPNTAVATALDIIERKRRELEAAGLLTAQRDPLAVEAYHRRLGLQGAVASTTSTGAASPLPTYLQEKLTALATLRAERLAQFRQSGGKCEACWDDGLVSRLETDRLEARYCGCAAGVARERDDLKKREAEYLDERAVAWGQTGLPVRWRDYTLTSSPVSRASDVWLGVQQWLTQPEQGCVITGPTGTGKTGLVVGMLRARSGEPGWAVRYVFTPELLSNLKDAYQHDRSEEEILAPLRSVRLLALDDLGIERRTDWSSDKLGELISVRHAHALPTIVASNFDLERLADRFGEQGARIIFRLAEQAGGQHIYTTDGLPNLRDVGR